MRNRKDTIDHVQNFVLLLLSLSALILLFRLPLLSGGLLAAFAVAFMLSMADVGTVLILMPAGMEPLSVKIYNYLHYGSSELVAGFCYFQVLLCMAVMLLTGLFLSTRKKRRGTDNSVRQRGRMD